MHYDLQQDHNTGNWWIIHQDEDGYRTIVRTLSADLTSTSASLYGCLHRGYKQWVML